MLLEQSTTTLKVTDVDARSSWKDVIITVAGARVHVGFQLVGAPEEQERVWARLNTLGTPEPLLASSCCPAPEPPLSLCGGVRAGPDASGDSRV